MRFSSQSLFLSLGSAFFFNNASAQECVFNATEGLRLSVAEAQETMFDSWDEVCGENCVETNSPLETISSRKYTNFMNINGQLNFYDQYITACAEAGMSVCLVTNTQKITVPAQEALGIPESTVIVEEIDKPVCFPNTCAESQVGELNVLDKQCQFALAAGESCEFQSIATCPANRTIIEESVSCVTDNPRPLSQVQLSKQALYGVMDAQCADAAGATGPNTARFCEMETKPAVLSKASDYTSFIDSSPIFRSFHMACAENGGSVCGVDFSLQYTPFAAGTAVVSFDLDYVNYPICVPKTCDNDQSLAEDYILDEYVGTEVGVSLCGAGSCEFELKNLNCLSDPEIVTEVPEEVESEVEEEIVDSVEETVEESQIETDVVDEDESESMDGEESESEDEDEMDPVDASSAMSAQFPLAKFVLSALAIGAVIGQL